MRLIDKLPQAMRAVEFIARHDDAPLEERAKVLNKLRDYIDQEEIAAIEREHKKKEEQS